MKIKAKLKFYDGKNLDTHEASCLLTISVGQPNHEGQYFLSTLESINKNFNECHIFVCDTLQRFNIELIEGISPKDALILARNQGLQWLDRNKIYLNKLTIKHSFSRWDNWLNHPKFEEAYFFMLHKYDTNSHFKYYIEKTIDAFYKRRKQTFSNVTFERLHQNSLAYLLEEFAVQKIISIYNFHYEIYPSKRNPILSFCHEQFIGPKKLIPISLKFCNVKLAA